MSVMVDMPPVIVRQANEYAELSGCSFQEFLCRSVEMYIAEQERKRRIEADAWERKFNSFLNRTNSRNSEPYEFNRADAYEPEVAFA